jgi:hypothetical protein
VATTLFGDSRCSHGKTWPCPAQRDAFASWRGDLQAYNGSKENIGVILVWVHQLFVVFKKVLREAK